jgi:hypothetical protein
MGLVGPMVSTIKTKINLPVTLSINSKVTFPITLSCYLKKTVPLRLSIIDSRITQILMTSIINTKITVTNTEHYQQYDITLSVRISSITLRPHCW